MITFNKEQLEGLAKVMDNLATATMIAVIVGGFVDNKISLVQGGALAFIAMIFLVMAYIFVGRETMAVESLVILGTFALVMLGVALYADKHRSTKQRTS